MTTYGWTTFCPASSPEEAAETTRRFFLENEDADVTEISSIEPGRGPFGAPDEDLEDGYFLAGEAVAR